MKLLVTSFIILLSFLTSANDFLVRKHFNLIANEVNSYTDQDLIMDDLEVIVRTDQLIDNRGSIVDALGTKNRIDLNREAWLGFYKNGIDVRILVLHELLRANEINDDNYQVSLPIMDGIYFEESPSRREKTPYCPLHTSEFFLKEKTKNITVKGFGPFQDNGVIVYPNPNIDKAIKNGLENGRQECVDRGYEAFSVKRYGNTEIRSQNKNGFKKAYLKMKIYGQCTKLQKRKKKRKAIRRERCEKAESCLELIRNYPFLEKKQNLEEKSRSIIEENC